MKLYRTTKIVSARVGINFSFLDFEYVTLGCNELLISDQYGKSKHSSYKFTRLSTLKTVFIESYEIEYFHCIIEVSP